jgi:cobalt/nickel transport system ATP-binding protein
MLLVASHDMRLVWELCSRTVILHGGRVVAHSPTVELLPNSILMEPHGLESPYCTPELDTETPS